MKRLLPILCGIILYGSAWAEELINQQHFLMRFGDDSRWSLPDWKDDDWQPVYLGEVPMPERVLWLRASVQLQTQHLVRTHPTGLYFAALASHEIYWDGVLIGRGGTPGPSASQEIPGPIQTHYFVPEHLAAAGEHVIAVRTSAHHRHFAPATGYWLMLIGDYDTIIGFGRRITNLSLISLSGMILIAIFALLLFLVNRDDRSYLLLSLLATVAALLLIAEAWRNVFGYTYNYHLLRLILVYTLSGVLTLLILLFMIVRFPGKYGRIFLSVALVGFACSAMARGWDNKSLLVFITGFGLSLIWTLRAAIQRRRGSPLASVGLLATAAALVWQPYMFADVNLYFSVNFLLLCLLAAHVLQVKQVRIEREEARIKSARLEIELIKKYIQPHYLMNTLTAMSEWIEQQPQEAVKMIQALSDEFRVLSEISHCSLIPMRDEIRLCSAHLEIMSRRKGFTFELCTDGIDLNAMVPPAVIHTIVENAIVHNRPATEHVRLQLTAERENGFLCYTFCAPHSSSELPEVKEGTGFLYIKTRLKECYGQNWHFQSAREGDSWKTRIKIPL